MTVPAREVSQQRLDQLSSAILRHVPKQKYTVADRLEEQAAAHPNRPFLFFEDSRISYGELNAAANRVAHAAMRAGLVTGDVVALMMENRPEFIITWAGLAKLGVTVALLNSNVGGQPLRHALDTTRATHLIVGSECVDKVASLGGDIAGVRTIYVSADPASAPERVEAPAGAVHLTTLLAQMPTENPDAALRQTLVAGDDLFYMFTSGTT